jgi:hypothetical protein
MTMLGVREERLSDIQREKAGAWSNEAVAFCPTCKAFQTIWLDGGRLMPTRKFYQEGHMIYHDCGSRQPCRLYSSW